MKNSQTFMLNSFQTEQHNLFVWILKAGQEWIQQTYLSDQFQLLDIIPSGKQGLASNNFTKYAPN